jgi:hypothetical protein
MVLVGNLKDLRLANIIQINCIERNVAKVTVSSHNRQGYLYFADGQIVHAELSPYIGEKAVREMLSLADGKFKVEAGVQAPTLTIKRPWNSIVLDSLREIDEKNQQSTSIPKQVIALLSEYKGVKNIGVLDFSGKLIEGKLSEELNTHSLSFVWYKTKKILTLFYTENFRYAYLRNHWSYLFIIEFQASVIIIETDLSIFVNDFVRYVSRILKGIS